MGIRENIVDLCTIIGKSQKAKESRQKEVLDFIQWAIINIPDSIKKQIGTINNVTVNYKQTNYGIELTLHDYNYWKNELKLRPDILFIEPKNIEQAILKKITDISVNEYYTSKEELENVITEINRIYET